MVRAWKAMDEESKQAPTTPTSRASGLWLWNAISIGLMVLGLTGLAESIHEVGRFFGGFGTHAGTFLRVLFGWLPFSVPYWLQIYLILGTACIAACQAVPSENDPPWGRQLRAMALVYVPLMLFWPFSFFCLVTGTFGPDPDVQWLERERRGVVLRNVAIAVVVLLVLVFVTSDLLHPI